ncbi:EboA domain-containing protein [Streptomyces sp. NPDC055055]
MNPRSRPNTLPALRADLDTRLPAPARAWTAAALAEAARAGHTPPTDAPTAAARTDHPPHDDPRPHTLPAWQARFAAAGRRCGPEHADAVRVLLLAEARPGPDTLARLYHQGSAAERRAVLLALPHLLTGPEALPLVEDALRTHDTRLVAAALGPYAATHLGRHAWRHAVLKCLFTHVPLDTVAGLRRRARGDAVLARMLADHAAERTAAGRPVPHDLDLVLALATQDRPQPPEEC